MNFFSWIKNKIFTTEPVSLPVVPPGIEDTIDSIVMTNIQNYQNILRLNSSIKYWQSTVKAICSAESGFNIIETYYESDLADSNGNDPVTGMRYLSEGLMQLSYSDAISYQCDFDIAGDKNKVEKDPTKTIFNIEKNIICGLKILDKLIYNHGDILINSGNYWSTLEPRNKRHEDFLAAFNKYQGL